MLSRSAIYSSVMVVSLRRRSAMLQSELASRDPEEHGPFVVNGVKK